MTFTEILLNIRLWKRSNRRNLSQIEPELSAKGFYFDDYCGSRYDEENDEYVDIYQQYIITSQDAERLAEYTNEIVFYNETLDMYVLGVTHWGTSWDYVLTDIKLNCGEEAFN